MILNFINTKKGLLLFVSFILLVLYAIFWGPHQSHWAFSKLYLPQDCNFPVEKYGPFEASGLGLNNIWLLAGYLMVVAMIGLPLMRWVPNQGGSPFFLVLAAAYLPGYLITVAVIRLMTIFFPNSVAPKAILVLLLGLGGFSFFYYCFSEKKEKQISLFRFPTGEVLSVLTASLLFIGALIGQAQVSIHCFTGDSTQFFLDNIITQKALDPSHTYLPFVNQHYDELMFVYPVVFSEQPQAISLFAIWLNSGAAKVSVIFMLFILLRRFTVSIPFTIIFCLYILVGTWALDPFKYFIFFDSATPHIFNLGGMGRILSTVLPWFLFFHFSVQSFGKVVNRVDLVTLGAGTFLFGLGITATSVHNAIYALGFTFVYLIYRHLWAQHNEAHIQVVRVPMFREISILSIVGMLGAYSFGDTITPTLGGGFFFILLVYAGCILSGTLMRDGILSFSKGNSRAKDIYGFVLPGTFLSGIVVGLTFLGNVFFAAISQKLTTILGPVGMPEIIQRISGNPHGIFKIFSAPDWLANSPSHNNIGPYDSLIAFLEYFGPMLFAMVAILYWMEVKHQKQDILNPHQPQLFIYVISSVSIFLFAASNFLKDFIRYIFEPHHLTRLLEYPFYAIMVAFIIMASHYLKGNNRLAFTLFAILWILIPIASHPILQQWHVNASRVFG